ncbi:hypothetical protein HMI01_14110 [Halolactibacillus miurensis]|uniref:Stage III sporulation protein AE (Spore_III_AE) n=1 Tax=Halolactibacillus miurensis TaxID=306541 RepID=A0A1I6PSL0_9BACI|nr:MULTISPECIES: hypothetical protein [Halolactibacillus]GEM04423.1 hypothetical protein HMI01_14110 [Halolactibacillus miurensis]SFS43181.1 Stage III sporulation protein AE (spore_III_AE) [Halolactibacillus miurensis]
MLATNYRVFVTGLICGLIALVGLFPSSVIATENQTNPTSYDTLINELDDDLALKNDASFHLHAYLTGTSTFSLKDYVMSLVPLFFSEVKNTVTILYRIMIYLILSMFVSDFFYSHLSTMAQSVISFTLKLLLIKECLTIFHLIENVLSTTVETMYGFIIVLLSSVSGLSLILQPLSMMQSLKPLQLLLLPLSFQIFKQIIMPLIHFQCLMALLGELFELLPLQPLAKKMGDWLHFGLSLLLKIYFSFLMLSSSFRFFQTRLSLMQEKHLFSQLYTLTGHWFQETAEMSFLTLGVLRDALGVYGVIALALVVMTPLIKMTAVYIVLTVFEAMIQTLSQSTLVAHVTVLNRTILISIRALVVFGFLFIGNILVVIIFAQFFQQ